MHVISKHSKSDTQSWEVVLHGKQIEHFDHFRILVSELIETLIRREIQMRNARKLPNCPCYN